MMLFSMPAGGYLWKVQVAVPTGFMFLMPAGMRGAGGQGHRVSISIASSGEDISIPNAKCWLAKCCFHLFHFI